MTVSREQVINAFAEHQSTHQDLSPAGLKEIACGLAELGGEVISHSSNEIGTISDIADTVETKSSSVDPVTAVDKATESTLVEKLLTLRPNDGVVGEEGAGQQGSTGIDWIIDPIDGTVNFLYGIPEYAVSVAAVWGSVPVAGAVYNVAGDVMYSAHIGGGAYAITPHTVKSSDGFTVVKKPKRLRTNSITDSSAALVATGFSYLSDRRLQQASILARLLGDVRDIRRMGSAALDLCRVASGQVDAFYEAALNKWDYAAGMLIAQEAGAVVRAPKLSTEGSAGEVLVAYAPGIAETMDEILRSAGALASLPINQ